jgi:hypothetical protein
VALGASYFVTADSEVAILPHKAPYEVGESPQLYAARPARLIKALQNKGAKTKPAGMR